MELELRVLNAGDPWKVPEKGRWCGVPTGATGLESEDVSLHTSFAACGLSGLGRGSPFSEPQFPHL